MFHCLKARFSCRFNSRRWNTRATLYFRFVKKRSNLLLKVLLLIKGESCDAFKHSNALLTQKEQILFIWKQNETHKIKPNV